MKRRILFVDDEPKILQGLRRMLRSMRHEWEMEFAESGPDALNMLDREAFDVVVSDMRMPGMDGSDLLTQIQRRFPSIVRIVLSGHSDQESILKSVRPAHQYLSKPCEPELLISTVKRSCALRDLLRQESLRRIVSQTESLPCLPSLYTELMEELRLSDGSIERVGEIIEKDIGMTAKLAQLVNSSFFGLPRHISNPSQAVILLGFDTVKSLVLTVGLFSQFDPSALSVLHVESIYNHSMKTGAIARQIAKSEHIADELIDNAFMAGLLHDIGKLVLAARLPEAYREVFELIRQGGISFPEAETEILGASHADVGAYLLGLWGLPEAVVGAVAFHHNPRNCPIATFNPLTAVYAANILESHNHASADIEDLKKEFDSEYIKRLGLNERIPAWVGISQQIEGETDTNE
ncbi:MAG: HDOD domain-containing protein [Thermodesulfobacteriota bacterium]